MSEIRFSEGFSSAEYVLMEVDEHVLGELEANRQVSFKVEGRESAVLCTYDRTYTVRHADVSNSHYLLPCAQSTPGEPLAFPDDAAREVLANINTYFEIKQQPPLIEKVEQLLQSHSLYTLSMAQGNSAEAEEASEGQNDLLLQSRDTSTFRDSEGLLKEKRAHQSKGAPDSATSKGVTFEELSARIQASDEELEEQLSKLPVALINGRYWLLEADLLCYAQDQLLQICAVKEWDLLQLDEAACTREMTQENSLPSEITLAILRSLGEKVDDLWRLSDEKVSRFRALELLQQASDPNRQWNLESFMNIWSVVVPATVEVKREHLQGLGIIVESGNHAEVIRYFPAKGLPHDPRKRFRILFQAQSIWKEDDIIPYLQEIVSPLQPRAALIMKHARAFERDGIRYLNAK